jgi:hypothetical protein
MANDARVKFMSNDSLVKMLSRLKPKASPFRVLSVQCLATEEPLERLALRLYLPTA